MSLPILFYKTFQKGIGKGLRNKNLISWWKYDEVSGNLVDSHGNNNLSPTNAPGTSSGKVNGAREFVAGSSQFFSIASNSSLVMDENDFTIAIWFYADSGVGGTQYLLSKSNQLASKEYGIFRSDPNTIGIIDRAGTGETTSGISFDAWNFGIFWFDYSESRFYLQINNGDVEGGDNTILNPGDNGVEFRIGARGFTGNGDETDYFNGLLDETAIWKRLLSDVERNWLWNNGSGRAYGDL